MIAMLERKPYHRYQAGEIVGGWEIVSLLPNTKGMGVLACLGCRLLVPRSYATIASEVRAGRSGRGCRKCSFGSKKLPRLCRSCGTKDPKRFRNKVSECSTCNRRAGRNGRDAEGRAIYRSRARA